MRNENRKNDSQKKVSIHLFAVPLFAVPLFALFIFFSTSSRERKKGGHVSFFRSFLLFALSLSTKAPMSSSREIIGRFDFSCEIEVRAR